MSDYPPPPPPPAGGTPPPEPPPGQYGQGAPGQYGQGAPGGQYGQYGQQPAYGGAPQGYGATAPGGTRPGELLDRFLARLIDTVLFVVVNLVLGLILGIIIVASDGDDGATYISSALVSLLSTAIILGYYGYLESTRGASLGKMAMKLKVVTPAGGNPTFGQAVKRNNWLALGVLGIIPVLGGLLNIVLSIVAIVLLVVGINKLPDRRTWFDKFAGDLQVVKIG
jgi:uncharacterized RDD family membrane protein YckC